MKKLFFFSALIIVFMGSMENVQAQIPRTISFQGVLADAQGNLVPDGNHQLQIVLYDQATFGNQVFIENQTVPVVKGIFNVIIGSVNPLPTTLTFDRAYFLGVSVDGGQELTPRTALTSVPYALRAVHANTADALSPNATGVVTKVNGQDGDISLIGGGSTTVTNNGNQITIASTGGGGNGIQGVQNTDGTITVQNPNGPVATIGLANGSVTPDKISSVGAGAGQALMYNGASVKWTTPSGGGGTGVSSLNTLTNAVTLAASGGATISSNGNTITINAGSGSGGTGIQGVQNTDNTLDIINPGGPTATINVKNQGVTTTKLADGAVTSAKIQDGQVQTNEIGNNAITSAKIASGQVVKSINTLKDDVTLAAGTNITITPTGNTLTIASTGGGTNYWTANGNDISNTNTGNVGIGTSAPDAAYKLEVDGQALLKPGGTGGDIAFGTPNGETGMTIKGTSVNRADVRFDGTTLKLLATGAAGPPPSKNGIVIDTYGNVGIGVTTPSLYKKFTVVATAGGTFDGVYGESSSGDGVVGYSASGYGVRCNGNGCYSGTWGACSDGRYKKDVTPLSHSLLGIMKLQGINYHWKTKDFPEKHFNEKLQIGFIAQDVEPLYPEVVTTDKEGYKTIDYSKLTPILVEAMKEQQKMIAEQESIIKEIQNKLAHIEKQMTQTSAPFEQSSMIGNK